MGVVQRCLSAGFYFAAGAAGACFVLLFVVRRGLSAPLLQLEWICIAVAVVAFVANVAIAAFTHRSNDRRDAGR